MEDIHSSQSKQNSLIVLENDDFKVIENNLQNGGLQNDDKNIKQKRVLSIMRKLSNQSYDQTQKLPSVRKMIQTISHLDSQNHTHNIIDNQKTLLNSQFSSNNSFNSNKSNRKNRLKNISKLISLQNSHLQRVKPQYQSPQVINSIHSNIYSLMDDIYNSKNSDKSFFSQPHYLTKRQNNKNNKHQNKNQSKNNQNTIKYVSIPRSFRTLENQNDLLQKIVLTQSIDKMNKQRTIKNYLKTINVLENKKKSQLSNKDIFKTIDQRQVSNYDSSLQKQLKYTPSKKNKNKLVSKIIDDKKQKDTHKTNEMKQIIKRRQRNSIVFQSPQSISQRYQYKRKGKQYFHIQINKSQHSKHLINNKIDQILPQIKVNSKCCHPKIN